MCNTVYGVIKKYVNDKEKPPAKSGGYLFES